MFWRKLKMFLPKLELMYRAHRIGPNSFADGKAKQQVIVRLTTWRHRTAIYRARKKSNKVKICLDLTKPRLNLIIAANELLKEHKDSFAFADVNCRPRVEFNGKFSFFDTVDDIMALVSAEDNNHECASVADDSNDESTIVSEDGNREQDGEVEEE